MTKSLYSEEQIKIANQTNLVEYLKYRGEHFEKSGREWRWMRHDSVTVRGNRWFRHSEQKGGYPIGFLKEFYTLTFTQAMQELLSYNGSNPNAVLEQQTLLKEYVAPSRFSNSTRITEYLIHKRFIDEHVLSEFIQKGLIYEDRDYHNIVFAGYSEDGTMRHAHKKSIYSNFRGNVEGSSPEHSFYFKGTNHRLYVFEAPIDLLSFISLLQKDWQENHYLALNGLSMQAIKYRLSMCQKIDEIVLCLDHDHAGLLAMSKFKELFEDQGYTVNINLSKFKDWNDDLKAARGVEITEIQEDKRITEGLSYIQKMNDEMSQILESDYELRDMITAFFNIQNYEKLNTEQLEMYLKEMMLAADALRYQSSKKIYSIDYQYHKDNGSYKQRIQRMHKLIDDLKTVLYSSDKQNPTRLFEKIIDECAHFRFDINYQKEEEQIMNEKSNKPKAALIGANGNIYNLMGIASKALNKNGQRQEAKEMVDRITKTAKSYPEALNILSQYVDVVSEEDLEEDIEHVLE